MHIAHSDKPVATYPLDIILSVGYRTNSKIAIEFRKWATKTLREHITKGYTVNRRQIAKNYSAFMKSVSDIQALLPEQVLLDPKTILELSKEFCEIRHIDIFFFHDHRQGGSLGRCLGRV